MSDVHTVHFISVSVMCDQMVRGGLIGICLSAGARSDTMCLQETLSSAPKF